MELGRMLGPFGSLTAGGSSPVTWGWASESFSYSGDLGPSDTHQVMRFRTLGHQ